MSARSSAKNNTFSVSSWLQSATQHLALAGVETDRLDCLVLLEDATQKDRAWLLAHPEYELSLTTHKKLDKYIVRRANHEPLAYIRGTTEFYGRQFQINKHVLVPRPESESIIDLLLAHADTLPKNCTIVDIGTGSGILAVTAKLEIPTANVIATDISAQCRLLATENAAQCKADIQVIESDLLNKFSTQKTLLSTPVILLCNLPYVPKDYSINLAAKHEPDLALFSGADGLTHYRKLFEQIVSLDTAPQLIITESLAHQHDAIKLLAHKSGYSLVGTSGLAQIYIPAGSLA